MYFLLISDFIVPQLEKESIVPVDKRPGYARATCTKTPITECFCFV